MNPIMISPLHPILRTMERRKALRATTWTQIWTQINFNNHQNGKHSEKKRSSMIEPISDRNFTCKGPALHPILVLRVSPRLKLIEQSNTQYSGEGRSTFAKA